VSANCEEGNKLNAAAARGSLSKLVVYSSPEDDTLRVGEFLAGEWAEGDLGRVGPKNASAQLEAITRVETRFCGHSDWVARDFEKTMELVTGV
jgi:hypothetical protein